MEKKLVAITGTPIASLREGYGFYIGRTDNINREGAIKARIDRKGASEEDKEYDSKYLVTIVKYASKIIAQERIQKNFSTQVGKLNDMKTAIESSVNKMKITFHIGEQELKNSGSRKGYDEQKN
jgi:Uri superfamily endonuclease